MLAQLALLLENIKRGGAGHVQKTRGRVPGAGTALSVRPVVALQQAAGGNRLVGLLSAFWGAESERNMTMMSFQH